MTEHTLLIGNRAYRYGVIHQERKTISLNVYPDQSILVKCPPRIGEGRLRQFLKKKTLWLEKKVNYFKNIKRDSSQKEYVSGESFQYMGRQYQLYVTASNENKVSLSRGKISIGSKESVANGRANQQILEEWFKLRANTIITKRFEQLLKEFPYEYQPKLRIKKMKTRWGSCTKKGNITLNEYLIRTPLHCIDYVIIHELCHLVEHNHSPKFYKIMTKLMPDWQKRKQRLSQCAAYVEP